MLKALPRAFLAVCVLFWSLSNGASGWAQPEVQRPQQVKTVIAELVYPGATVEELEKIGDRQQILIEKSFPHSNNLTMQEFSNFFDFLVRDAFASGQTTVSVMVYIPKFTTSGMPQAGLDDLEMGGFWLDKYEASQPDATASFVGSTSTNSPGTTAAVSQAGVVVWHTIDWTNAKTACANRGQVVTDSDDGASGGTTTTLIDTDSGDFPANIVGRHLEITHAGTTYYCRRITAYDDATDTITFTPALPAAVVDGDSYTIKEYHLVTPYEWASVAYWCCMHTQPKGNNSYGNDSTDDNTDATTFGQLDPTELSTQVTDRVLTGTGPKTWSHNQQASGVWDLNGNVWEWVDLKIGTQTNHQISDGFPGEGFAVPSSDGNINQLEASNATVKMMAIPPADGLGSANPDYGSDYYWQDTGERAAVRGGHWGHTANAGVFLLYLSGTPSITNANLGFRAAR